MPERTGAATQTPPEILEALRESEARYRSLFEESRDTIFISTRAGRFVDINPAGVALLGYPSKESLTSADLAGIYVRPGDRDRLFAALDAGGFVEEFATLFRRHDGDAVRVSLSASVASRDADGKAATIRGLIRDVTEHQKLEAQLRQAQKMESIGTLAGGVAHDFNNMLTAISGYGHLALAKMAPDDPNRGCVEGILEAADRAAHLTRDLLLFSRKHPINRTTIDLNAGVRRLAGFLRRVIGEDITLTVELAETAIPVFADEHQIGQVLMNLATNARDAMPDGGVFTIRTGLTLLDDRFVAAHEFGAPGPCALLTVTDTGAGMDEPTRQRVFEPFFTTKEPGAGTGLGMAVVYGIVRQHDGLATVHSEPGLGTTLRIYLPLAAPAAAGGPERAASPRPAGGAETILLAEDDPAVRRMMALLLRDYGYTVLEAADGEEAVRRYREQAGRVDLLLLDLVMPRLSGKEAYDAIQRERPGAKVVFVSGYDPDAVRQQALLELGLPMIHKPVEVALLLKTLRSVLQT
jgi:PAS domain S-box-containing protein